MRWTLPALAGAVGAAVLAPRRSRSAVRAFRDDVRAGMAVRESQLREVLAMDTHLTLPGERADDARAIQAPASAAATRSPQLPAPEPASRLNAARGDGR